MESAKVRSSVSVNIYRICFLQTPHGPCSEVIRVQRYTMRKQIKGFKARSSSNLHQQDLFKLGFTRLPAASPEKIAIQAQGSLQQQDLFKLGFTKLSLSPEKIKATRISHSDAEKTNGHNDRNPTTTKAGGLQTLTFKNKLKKEVIIKLERVSESVIELYRDKTEEKQESLFYEKVRATKKRNLSLDFDDSVEEPLTKKVKIDEAEEFIIEKILDFKYESDHEYFYIKWKGFADIENTWEPIEHLDNCDDLLKEFLNAQEIKHCEKFNKFKEEISFDDLLSEDNLKERLHDLEYAELPELKKTLLLKLLSVLSLKKKDEGLAADLVQDTRDVLQLYVLARKRCKQLIALQAWEKHINQVDNSKKLAVENTADLQGPPENFTYINQCIPGAGVTIPDEPPIGCECESCNCRSKSCCGMQAGLFAYTTKKLLRVALGTPIYECNKACKCSADCSNRVVQRGRNVKLTIYRTLNDCGWGVRTEQKIKQGQFVCQYVGEVITFEEAEKRGREYDANGLTYLFDLDFNCVENPYVVDAAHLGNVSHFINHSCDPNLAVWAVWADCLDPNLPMLALFATRDIEAGEEICFDYLQKNDEKDTNRPSGSRGRRADDDNDSVANGSDSGRAGSPVTPVKLGANMSTASQSTQIEIPEQNLRIRTECKCGAVKCRKYLF